MKLQDTTSRQRGRYRAEFSGEDLGFLGAPPKISAGYECIAMPVSDTSAPAGYSEVETPARLSGKVYLTLGAVAEALQLLSDLPEPGVLILRPEFPGTGQTLRFPVAKILPQWEFVPGTSGNHTVQMCLKITADAAGKLFYCA